MAPSRPVTIRAFLHLVIGGGGTFPVPVFDQLAKTGGWKVWE